MTSNKIWQKMQEDGYVVLEDFLSPSECDEMVAAGTEFTKNLPPKEQRIIFSTVDSEKKQLQDEYFLNSNDSISYFFEASAVGPDGELTVDPSISLNKVGHALHYQHPIFRCYTYCDRVKEVAKALGFKEPAVVQSMYIYKNPGVGGEVTAHQDITYLHTAPIPPVGFWIALEDATVQNGCLWIVPGSHKSGVHRRLTRNFDKDSKDKLIYDSPAPFYPQSRFTAVPVSKGTCIVLHGNVVHRSAHNHSSNGRPAYTFHIVEKQDNQYSADNWLQEGERAPFSNLYTTSQLI
ncbi:phytanoyl-CoA dioxygenase domain-containing protein 1 homolog [Spodoptera frugiperda]|uniref:Phytanoyl-CoA dioxygenase domain-containing protein 1 homolog n=1 Tax=Spodoptera frugiperda TaxID=7108 RepID=A0A9R0EFM1_SPOFR|nr:phytanoyl-CoA dioxygenase domain-containing protein 1 homolog [Spodoptera frugiperda]